jgi:hypothetical protein
VPENENRLSEERLSLVHRYMTEAEGASDASRSVSDSPRRKSHPSPPEPPAVPPSRAPSDVRPAQPQPTARPAEPEASAGAASQPARAPGSAEHVQAPGKETSGVTEEGEAQMLPESDLPILEWLHSVAAVDLSPPDPDWPVELIRLRRERWKRYHESDQSA